MWKAVEATFEDVFKGEHIDKIGFAKELIDYVDASRSKSPRPAGLADLERNFRSLSAALAALLRGALEAEADRRRNKRLRRVVRSFIQDNPDGASRDEAELALREIETSLEEVYGDEEIAIELARMRRDFELGTDPLAPVADFPAFLERFERLMYRERLATRR